MPIQLVCDSSVLLAFERAQLLDILKPLAGEIVMPKAVQAEVRGIKLSESITVIQLTGRSIKKSRSIEHALSIGRGEAECCALAIKLKTGFMLCDDRKFVRQKFFSADRSVKAINVFGFSLFLHVLCKRKQIENVWPYFEKIINSNNWQRSEVLSVNHAFLKEKGY